MFSWGLIFWDVWGELYRLVAITGPSLSALKCLHGLTSALWLLLPHNQGQWRYLPNLSRLQPIERERSKQHQGNRCEEEGWKCFRGFSVPLASCISKFFVQPLVAKRCKRRWLEGSLVDAVGCTTFITAHINPMAMAAEWRVYGSGRGHRIFRHPDAELGPVQLRLSIRPMALPKTCRSALSHIPWYVEVFTFCMWKTSY